ncbi:MAG: hypothetical protein H9W80_00950 [Enterococcus sp.]|nr:hypothetical protein [Enterococcus sp.]
MNQDLTDIYLSWICSLNSPATIHRYEVAVKRFSKLVWNKAIYEVEISEWQNLSREIVAESFLKPIKRTSIKLSTLSGYFSAVKSYLNHLNGFELSKFELRYYEALPSKKELESRLIDIEREVEAIKGMLEKYRN